MRFAIVIRVLCAAAFAGAMTALAETPLAREDVQRVLSFGPWPPAPTVDPGNRVSGNPAAIELGRQLFFDARLSRVGYIACVTCHQPDRAWGDGKARAHGLACEERAVTESELRRADELMLSSSTKELLPITRLDGKAVGSGKPGPLHARLHALYQDYIRDFRAGKVE